MKKHWVALFVTILLIGIFVFVSFRKTTILKEQQYSLIEMPDFEMVLSGDKAFTKDSLWQDYHYLFVFLKPGCDHCDYLVSDFKTHPDYFRQTMVFFITKENLNLEHDNVGFNFFWAHMAKDVFYVKGSPRILLYNADKQLVYEYTGEINTETILSYIIQANEPTSNKTHI